MTCELPIRSGPNRRYSCIARAHFEVKHLLPNKVDIYHVCPMHLARVIKDLCEPYDREVHVTRIEK